MDLISVNFKGMPRKLFCVGKKISSNKFYLGCKTRLIDLYATCGIYKAKMIHLEISISMSHNDNILFIKLEEYVTSMAYCNEECK